MKTRFFLSLFAFCFLMLNCSKEQCPNNYTGEDCDEEIRPLIITVTDIILTKYPSRDSDGDNWDFFDDPDIYINIGNAVVSKDTGYYEDEDRTTIGWNDIDMIFTMPLATFKLSVYDYDPLDSDDLMGQIPSFTLYTSGQDFPSQIILENVNIRVVLKLEYTW